MNKGLLGARGPQQAFLEGWVRNRSGDYPNDLFGNLKEMMFA